MQPPEYTVVYDGKCSVCARVVSILASWDRNDQLELVPAQTPGLAARFPWIPASAYLESIQLVRRLDERTWQGAAAIEHLLKTLPRGRFLSWIFAIPFARPAAEKFYQWFARNRYHLGCGEHCRLP